jgi:tetratricopeptide (TPR) repeat protein
MKKYILVFAFIAVLLCKNNQYSAFAQTKPHESDLEFILTNYYILGNYEEALRLLNKYYFNNQKELSYLFGLCYLKLNMNKMAIDYFNITLSEHEDNYEVLNNIGAAYFQSNDFVNAMKYFHLSFIANPNYEIAQKNYNAAYAKRVSETEDGSISPIIPFTEKPTMYNSLGWFYYYAGDFHNAIYYFNKAIIEDEKYQFAYIGLAYLYDEGNNFETALDYLRRAEKISDKNPDLYNNMGIVYYHLNDYRNSENAFKKAISLNDKFAEPYNNLGFLYIDKKEYKLSEDNFNKSIGLNIDNKALRAESVAGLAIISAMKNNTEQSKEYKEFSVSLDYRMNDVRYLKTKLKWSNELILFWIKI